MSKKEPNPRSIENDQNTKTRKTVKKKKLPEIVKNKAPGRRRTEEERKSQ